MTKLDKKRFFTIVAILLTLLAVIIVISYIPVLSHLEMIFRVLPQAYFYLIFGFALTYVQSHYDKKEAENGAKYLTINNVLLKKILFSKNRITDSQGYIKVENRSKITVFSVVLYLIGVLIVCGIIIMICTPQIQTKTIHILFGGSVSRQDNEINTVNSIFIYFSSMAYMILPLIGFVFRNVYFIIRSKNKDE